MQILFFIQLFFPQSLLNSGLRLEQAPKFRISRKAQALINSTLARGGLRGMKSRPEDFCPDLLIQPQPMMLKN